MPVVHGGGVVSIDGFVLMYSLDVGSSSLRTHARTSGLIVRKGDDAHH